MHPKHDGYTRRAGVLPKGMLESSETGAEAPEECLANYEFKLGYRTGEDEPAREFYAPCLERAASYDRAVGFFRSTVFEIIGKEIIDFAQRGGRMRLLCSPELSRADIQALKDGTTQRDEIQERSLDRDIEFLLRNAKTQTRFEALATLIAVGSLDLRIVSKKSGYGMFHEKLGIFRDAHGNTLSFAGSNNESGLGWFEEGNLEAFEVFCSWLPSGEHRVARHLARFRDLWEGTARDAVTTPLPEAIRLRMLRIARPSLSDVRLPRCEARETQAPYGRVPYPHQVEALQNWRAAGFRGIFHHATGSGKTFTAILAIKEHLEAGGVVLIVVPSQLLLTQWQSELSSELPDAIVMLAGGGNNAWKKPGRLRVHTRSQEQPGAQRIVLATMQTASTAAFLSQLSGGEHMLLVADEVHQTGSEQHRRLFGIDAGRRLGLSATPERYGDSAGTEAILEYFGPVVEPPFLLQDAIGAGRLVEYEYFPHAVHLSEEESERWSELSERISREIARSSGGDEDGRALTERAKLLLIQRARIAKKAAGKVELATEVLRHEYQSGQRWLVYCEDSEQLSQCRKQLLDAGLPALEYHTQMTGDPKETLKKFVRSGGILVSIRCLDEGVDIPEITHALILASSQNPRQFIQRRGRVLRQCPRIGKTFAMIHDAIAVPPIGSAAGEHDALVRAEIARALEFAEHALNRYASAELRQIAMDQNLDLELLESLGEEDETGERTEEG